MEPRTHTWVDTPIGPLLAMKQGNALIGIHFAVDGTPAAAPPESERRDDRFSEVTEQLAAYFERRLDRFELKLELHGTVFQQQVWRALLEIPYGTTTTYSAIAASIRRPEAVRAVGAANGANPIPIVVPCHRVVGRDGSLTGFGGGLQVKRFLLDLETYAASMKMEA